MRLIYPGLGPFFTHTIRTSSGRVRAPWAAVQGHQAGRRGRAQIAGVLTPFAHLAGPPRVAKTAREARHG